MASVILTAVRSGEDRANDTCLTHRERDTEQYKVKELKSRHYINFTLTMLKHTAGRLQSPNNVETLHYSDVFMNMYIHYIYFIHFLCKKKIQINTE